MASRTLEAGAAIRVRLPSPLRSYANGEAEVVVAVPLASPGASASLAAVLAALDAAHPGIRFRMIDEQGRVRQHIKLFVGGELARDLEAPVRTGAELMIVAALSGG